MKAWLLVVVCGCLLSTKIHSDFVMPEGQAAPEPRMVTTRPNTPNRAAPVPKVEPQMLLRNLLVAMSSAQQVQGAKNVNSGNIEMASGTQPRPAQLQIIGPETALTPMPPKMSELERKELLAKGQKALDSMHMMPDEMLAVIQKIGHYALTQTNPPTAQDTELLQQFVSNLHLNSPGSASVMQFLGSVSSGTKPMAPSKPFLEAICNLLWLVQVVLMMPLLQIPALVQMFTEPMMMVPPPVRQPAPARPRTAEDKIFHAYGDYGDYGYEQRGNKGYGCASGKCAPWWWTWRKRSPYYPFIGRQ